MLVGAQRLLVRELRKKYAKNVTALNGVTFEIEQGEVLSVLGPSGSGKTTLLRCIAGLEQVDYGRIIIGDRDVTLLRPKERNVAMVFQNYALYPHMTVFQNIAFPLRNMGVKGKELKDKVKEIAEFLEIGHLLDRKPKQLSGGERQRVALARALVRKPSVFLLDEPLSNVDQRLKIRLRTELLNTLKKSGVTAIYVTHNQEDARILGDRVAVLHRGRIVQMADSIKIYEDPEHVFVATFIGDPPMNVFKGEVEGGDLVIDAEHTLPLPVMPPKSPVVVGFRPEDIDIGMGIEVEVISADPRGREWAHLVNWKGLEFYILLPVQEPKGKRIRVCPRKVYFFDIETGSRLR